MAIYLTLFHGRATLEEDMTDWGESGPVLGPFTFAHVTYGETVRCGTDDNGGVAWFDLRDGCVFYGGVWYGDFIVSADPQLAGQAVAFDKAKAALAPSAR